MSRCEQTTGLLVVHAHVADAEVNSLANAKVLCCQCWEEATLFGVPSDDGLPEFSEFIKNMALQRAGNQCECTRFSGCH